MKSDINVLDRIIGEKKELHLFILKRIADGFTHEEVASIVNLSRSRVSQIFEANKELCDELTQKADLAKSSGRLRFAFRNIRRKDGRSAKDQLDWLEYVRKEMVGDKPAAVINNTVVNSNRVGTNGSFDGEDRELTSRLMGVLREKLQK